MTEGVSFYELRWLMSFCEAVESQAHDPTRDLSASFFFFFFAAGTCSTCLRY